MSIEQGILSDIISWSSLQYEDFENNLYDPKLKRAYEHLVRLNLLELKEGQLRATPEGYHAHKIGFENWVEDYVFEEIKLNQFRNTKETIEPERNALRNLEQKNRIYTRNNIRYFLTPHPEARLRGIETLDILPMEENDVLVMEQSSSNQSTSRSLKFPWSKFWNLLGWLIIAVLTVLALLEARYGYFGNFWERYILGN